MTKWPQKNLARSETARSALRRRERVRALTGGKCFYCGCPTIEHGTDRDWLLPSPRYEMVQEHKTPIVRGGDKGLENQIPACAGCNLAKGAFTLKEFRFARGLTSNLNFRFAFEPSAIPYRDWIHCHSSSYERGLLVHNVPTAARAFDIYRGRARGSMGRK